MDIKILCIDEGHSLNSGDYGAVGNGIKESEETRILGALVKKYLNQLNVEVNKCTVDYANSVTDSINNRLALLNTKNNDLLVIIHFNAFSDPNANGTEVLMLPYKGNYYQSKNGYDVNYQIADRLSKAVASAGVFNNRGVKFREDLGMLIYPSCYAVYLEVCFISNKEDSNRYKANKEKIAKAIAESVTNKKINNDEKVVKKVKNLVVYGNQVDKRAAEYLADYLNCPVYDGNKAYDYSVIENVYCVGGEPSVAWTGYAKHKIAGSDRYETIKEVLKFIKKL